MPCLLLLLLLSPSLMLQMFSLLLLLLLQILLWCLQLSSLLLLLLLFQLLCLLLTLLFLLLLQLPEGTQLRQAPRVYRLLVHGCPCRLPGRQVVPLKDPNRQPVIADLNRRWRLPLVL